MDDSESEVNHEPIYYLSRDKKMTWCSEPDQRGPTTRFQGPAKLIGKAARASTVDDCFSLFFTPSIMKQIVQLTNQRIEELVESGNHNKCDKPTDEVEMKAFFGILLLTAIYLYDGVKELWDTGYGAAIFRATIGYARFTFLLKCTTYVQDPQYDVFDFLDTFNENCEDNFELGPYAALEEQVMPFRGNYPFRSLGNRSEKGIAILSVRDARVNYTRACVLHVADRSVQDLVGKVTAGLRAPARLFLTGQSLTSAALVEYFTASETFVLGQMKETAGEIPLELSALGTEEGAVPSVVYSNRMALIRHVDKREKPVFLLSNITSVDTALSDVVETYDILGGHVSAVDAMCKNYSCAKKTHRWEMALLFRLLDVACINTQIIFTIVSGNEGLLSRRQFIKKLSGELTRPYAIVRSQLQHLPHTVRQVAARLANVPCGISVGEDDLPPPPGKKRRCQVCPKPNDCKSSYLCCSCKRCICRKRAFLFCRECINLNSQEPDMPSD